MLLQEVQFMSWFQVRVVGEIISTSIIIVSISASTLPYNRLEMFFRGQHQVIVSVYNRLEVFFRLLFGHSVLVVSPPFVRVCIVLSE